MLENKATDAILGVNSHLLDIKTNKRLKILLVLTYNNKVRMTLVTP